MPISFETPRALEEFVGREIGVSDWVTVTQEQIQQFAEITDDRQWIHVEKERAQRESPYGTTVAHGFLTLSFLSRFLRDAISIRGGVRMTVNYGLNRVRFPSAVQAGARIRARFALKAVKELSGVLEAVFNATIEAVGNEKPCCVAEWVLRYYF